MSDYKKSVEHIQDAVVNDSDKVLTPAVSVGHRLIYGNVELIASSTVGNRQMTIEIRDAADAVVYSVDAGAIQAEDLTRNYLLSPPGGAREAAFVATSITIPIPADLIMLPGWDVRVYDSAAIDAAADDMTVDLMFENLNQVK